ncbi:thiol peroxidase [Pelomyxa schiedti]|nr:thiol peroxidase [Pelomyxa schiedti]
MEFKGLITFGGNPLTLSGARAVPTVGEVAPDFTVVANDLSPFKFSSLAGTVRIISSVPSLDTPVCQVQTRKFNQEASNLAIKVLTLSMDLPFAQKRWCGAEGITHVMTLSDHKDAEFGTAYGLIVKELRLLSRAVFVVGKDDKIHYAQLVSELTTEPDYSAALAIAKTLL